MPTLPLLSRPLRRTLGLTATLALPWPGPARRSRYPPALVELQQVAWLGRYEALELAASEAAVAVTVRLPQRRRDHIVEGALVQLPAKRLLRVLRFLALDRALRLRLRATDTKSTTRSVSSPPRCLPSIPAGIRRRARMMGKGLPLVGILQHFRPRRDSRRVGSDAPLHRD